MVPFLNRVLIRRWHHAYDEGLVNVNRATASPQFNPVTPRLKEYSTQRLTVSEAYGYLPPSILLTEVTVPYWLSRLSASYVIARLSVN